MTAFRHRDESTVHLRERLENLSATGIGCTRHGETRMRQRRKKKGDADLILAYGTQVDGQAWILRKRDADREIEARKREVEGYKREIEVRKRESQILERLRNRKVVVRGDRVITGYPSGSSDQKRTLKRARRKGFHNG